MFLKDSIKGLLTFLCLVGTSRALFLPEPIHSPYALNNIISMNGKLTEPISNDDNSAFKNVESSITGLNDVSIEKTLDSDELPKLSSTPPPAPSDNMEEADKMPINTKKEFNIDNPDWGMIFLFISSAISFLLIFRCIFYLIPDLLEIRQQRAAARRQEAVSTSHLFTGYSVSRCGIMNIQIHGPRQGLNSTVQNTVEVHTVTTVKGLGGGNELRNEVAVTNFEAPRTSESEDDGMNEGPKCETPPPEYSPSMAPPKN